MMVTCWKYILGFSALLMCYLFFQRLQVLPEPAHPRSRTTGSNFSVSECHHLRSIVLNSVFKIFKMETFMKVVKDLQECPWREDPTERNLLKEKLKKCCHASRAMIVTQENTEIGQKIRFDAETKITQNVTESLYSLFPEKSPFHAPLGSCAVVGNGGILHNSFCGPEIDRADFVFRMNLPPLNWTSDVGSKTNLVTANPSILINKFGGLMKRRKPFLTMVREYGSSLILLPAFSYLANTEVSLRAFYTLQDFDATNKVLFFNPDYLRNLTAYWKSTGLGFIRLSSGLMVVSAAMELCHTVTLYGFWPFSRDLSGGPILHHYYDNVPPKPRVHSMPDEFYQYLQMHIQGSLRLNLKHCT